MKQLAQYQDGRLELQDLPPPQPPPGGVLVQTTCSVISPGTEKMKVEQARMSLLQKARARPDQVRKVLDTARTLGWKAAYEKVRNRLESPTPLGYSAAGLVVAVDALNTRFKVGDRVACGGAECAFHAELIAVPDLLTAAIPDGVADWQAAYTTLASISLQAVRQAEPRLGDRVLVIGQGLVGLLATGLLTRSGARVLAVDFDPGRLSVAQLMGAEQVVNPAASSIVDHVMDWTQGDGVDAVLICVGGKGAATADTAIASLRDRGVMVIVGIHDAELSWKTAYMKDIQVRYSRSYGPGRYDPSYEWGGVDYPLGHVRWTENRNFEACLHLMQNGGLDLAPLTTRRAAFTDALHVYSELMQPGNTDIGVVLEYASGSSGFQPEGSSGFQPEGSSGFQPEGSSGFQPEGSSGFQPEGSLAGVPPALHKAGKMPATHPSGNMPELRAFIPFNPNAKTDKTRRNLPHWEQEGVTQFVTFRQADALPQEVLAQWTRDDEAWLAQHPRPWSAETEQLYQDLFHERKEQSLDQGYGSCLLADPEVSVIVRNAMHHFDGERYILDDYVIMPNHVHVLLKPLPGHDLSSIMHSWKSFTSREIKKRRGLGEAPFWQAERFDHALRSEAILELKREYIRQNPVKAGLRSGFVVGSGIGVVGSRSSGFQPESSSGFQPEGSLAGVPPAPHKAGKMPATHPSGKMPELRNMPELHVIGAGNFARTMLLPHLAGQLPFASVINGTGLSAQHVKQKFGFRQADTQPDGVFASTHSAVLIATRHHLHAPLVLRGLAAHQHVFVEKPLCLTEAELREIDTAMRTTLGSVMVGFNRRFAPATAEVKRLLASAPGPCSIAYHVFAGPLPKEHWYANHTESGGRILGEACHFFDFFCHLIDSPPVSVSAQAIGHLNTTDSIMAQVAFADGSNAQLIYTAAGDHAFPKESWRVFANGLVAECENFQKLAIFQKRKRKNQNHGSKGHAEEMAAWRDFLLGKTPHPLPYAASRQSMALTFAALQSIRENTTIPLSQP
jgi:predicted dehydrogenase/threonine dehydrogenase-like Zn-dependent dehydrogenase/REP element-mobilizing transposase RayT